jgi:hypothetical protein
MESVIYDWRDHPKRGMIDVGQDYPDSHPTSGVIRCAWCPTVQIVRDVAAKNVERRRDAAAAEARSHGWEWDGGDWLGWNCPDCQEKRQQGAEAPIRDNSLRPAKWRK